MVLYYILHRDHKETYLDVDDKFNLVLCDVGNKLLKRQFHIECLANTGFSI